jgi:hypothetical protein
VRGVVEREHALALDTGRGCRRHSLDGESKKADGGLGRRRTERGLPWEFSSVGACYVSHITVYVCSSLGLAPSFPFPITSPVNVLLCINGMRSQSSNDQLINATCCTPGPCAMSYESPPLLDMSFIFSSCKRLWWQTVLGACDVEGR